MPSFRRQTWLCPLYGIDWHAKEFKDRSLEELAKAHEIKISHAHQALADVGNAPGASVVEISGSEITSIPVATLRRSCALSTIISRVQPPIIRARRSLSWR
jgi:hypothetical protein